MRDENDNPNCPSSRDIAEDAASLEHAVCNARKVKKMVVEDEDC